MSANRGPAEDYLNQYKAGLKVWAINNNKLSVKFRYCRFWSGLKNIF